MEIVVQPYLHYDWNFRTYVVLASQTESYFSLEQRTRINGLRVPEVIEISQSRVVRDRPEAQNFVLRLLTVFMMETLYEKLLDILFCELSGNEQIGDEALFGREKEKRVYVADRRNFNGNRSEKSFCHINTVKKAAHFSKISMHLDRIFLMVNYHSQHSY